MDAKSLQVCPEPPESENLLKRLLLEAPILPYAASVLTGVWLGLHGLGAVEEARLQISIALLLMLSLGALLGYRIRRIGALTLVLAIGVGAGLHGRPPDPSTLDLDGPVEIEGRVASHPRGVPDEKWLWLTVERVTQKGRTICGSFDALVGLPPGDGPTSLAAPGWGQSIRLRGYLKTSPVLDNDLEGEAQRPGPWRLNLASWRFWEVTSPAPAWQRAATRARAAVDQRLLGADLQTLGSLLRHALVVGSPDHLPEELRRGLRATGLSHLLAVSGLHVGLLAGWLWLFGIGLGGTPLGRRTRLLLALLGVVAYVLLVGPKPSAMRAAGMAGVVALAMGLNRPAQALNAAALWASLLGLWEPSLLDDLGFRLSVAATIGILSFGPPLAESLQRLGSRVKLRGRVFRLACQALAVSLAAQLATLPLLTPWTSLVHPAAPLLNLLAIPWLTLFLGLSFASLPLLWLAPSLDPWIVSTLDLLAIPLGRLADAPPSLWTTLPVYLSLSECLALSLASLALLDRPGPTARVALVILMLGLPGSGPASEDGVRPPLEFLRLDVGQGDAILLRDGPRTVLVDGGGWRRGDIAARVLVPALARHGVRRLDAVALTHPDSDHCEGLLDLSRYVTLGEVWASPGWGGDSGSGSGSDSGSNCAARLVSRRGPRWRVVWRGDHAAAGRWRVDVLWPPPGLRTGEANDRSLVLRASGGRHRILLAADIGSATERRLVRLEKEDLRATILGIGHHGSKTSTSRDFLRAVSPRLATIGVGARNAYGHPHPTVMERLDGVGVRVHRTDRMGQLHLRLDPEPNGSPAPPRMEAMSESSVNRKTE